MAEYWGETARTAFERGEEHLEGLRNKYEKNSLWKHSVLYHEGTLTREDLVMKVVERHKSPLSRQIHEGVELEMNSAGIILNSKSEWNHSKIPRIRIEVGEETEEDNSSGWSRSTELGGKERKRPHLKVKAPEKREGDGIISRNEGGGKRPRTENEFSRNTLDCKQLKAICYYLIQNFQNKLQGRQSKLLNH